MANIYNVARRARVSAATVSAVNESAYVSPWLESPVEQAIERLQYRPNLVARSLAQQRIRTPAIGNRTATRRERVVDPTRRRTREGERPQ